MGQKKLRLRGWDPPSKNRAVFLRRLAVTKSKMVPRRPIWWQKGWFWGPLGFRAQPAHPWAPMGPMGHHGGEGWGAKARRPQGAPLCLCATHERAQGA